MADSVVWEKQKDPNNDHTAMTMYTTDGYKIWKGKFHVYSVIYSANEWHLQRNSDGKVLYSARTAKECMENFAWATSVERGW